MAKRIYNSTSDAVKLAASLSDSSLDTTLVVNDSSTLPVLATGQVFTLVIDPDVSGVEEIVTVTAKLGTNTYTVVRASNGSSAKSHAVAAVVKHMVTARDLQEPQDHIEATGAYQIKNDNSNAAVTTTYITKNLHGITTGEGDVVGTLKSQTLTNKTLTSPVVNGASLTGTVTNGGTISGGTFSGATISGGSASGITLSGTTDVTSGTVAFGTNASAVTANGATITATELSYLDGVTSTLANGYRYLQTVTYNTAGTFSFTKATYSGIKAIRVRLVGGGGGSGGTSTTSTSQCSGGGSGGGGGYSERFILASTLGTSETVTVGSGGTAGASGVNNGGAGGTSSFGTTPYYLSATGGSGGSGDAASSAPIYNAAGGAGGVGSGGDINIAGQKGGQSFAVSTSGQGVVPSSGGGSAFAPPYGTTNISSSGVTAVAGLGYGGGAAGAANAASLTGKVGAVGASGLVLVDVFV